MDWMLTEDEFAKCYDLWGVSSDRVKKPMRDIAAAAVKKYQEWLAKQVSEHPPCSCYCRRQGQREGYALGLQENDKLAGEILEFLSTFRGDWPADTIQRMTYQWLRSKGLQEREK